MQTNIAQQVSLTLMYEEEEIDTTSALDLDPMEIGSYVLTLQWSLGHLFFYLYKNYRRMWKVN